MARAVAAVCACLCLGLVLGQASSAAAQAGGRWLVIPYGINDNREAVAAADRVQVALQELELTLLSAHEARDKYVAGSRIPESLEAKDIELLVKEGQAALEHVAYGRHAAAQKSVREALTRAERALETLNRKTETARRVLDACLILVRSELGQDKRERALETAMRCRRLVPDVSPSETTHPASVIGVLAEAENKLRRWQVGKLQVESTPRTGCAVYVNGRHLGVTPFVLDRAAEGAYRVQVECDSVAGRVHEVTLGEKPVLLTVDSLLDRALSSEPRLTLTYPEGKLARLYVVGHAAAIGKQVGADDVVLVSVKDQALTLVRVQISQGRAIAEAVIKGGTGTGFSDADLEHALETLLAGRTQGAAASSVADPPALALAGVYEDVKFDAPATRAAAPGGSRLVTDAQTKPTSRSEPTPAGLRSRRLLIAGITLGTLGVAALSTGWIYELRLSQLKDELRRTALDDPKRSSRQHDFDQARTLTLIGIGGSALMTGAVPMFLPKVEGVPWWSYLIGGAGLGLSGLGVFELVSANRCIAPTTDGQCLERRDHRERGYLWLESAAPLLAVPVTHALRLAWGGHRVQIAPRVAHGGDSVLFGAEGSF